MQPLQPPNLSHISNPMREQLHKEMKLRKENLKRDFQAMDETNRRVVLESIFVRDFLPLFAGDKVDNREDMLRMWYIIAGTAFSPVDIVDNAGNKVHTVPAIMDTAPINPLATNKLPLSLGAEVDEAMTHSKISRGAAENQLTHTLMRRIGNVEVPQTMSPAWQALIDHYRKPKDAKGASLPASDPNSESDFE